MHTGMFSACIYKVQQNDMFPTSDNCIIIKDDIALYNFVSEKNILVKIHMITYY